ncbi:MAG TPA: thioredoxin family protein [Acidobacteriaceae bacterium]|jgi:thiol:disulfide interchange protein DsbD
MQAMRHYLRFIVIVLLTPVLASSAQLREVGTGAPGPVKAPHITAELISDSGAISPGGRSRVALLLTMESGWHVYWQYAGDSGQAPTVSWAAPQGITLGPMQYPAPSRLPLGPLMDYGYEGTAVFPYDLMASQQLIAGSTKLQAHVQWLVCREVCLPGKAFLGLALEVAPTASSVVNPLIDAAIRAEPSPLPQSVRVRASASRTLLTLDITTGKKEAAAEYYPLDDASIRNAAEQKIEPTSHGVKLVTERADISDTLPKEVKGVLKLSDGRSFGFDVPVMAPIVQANSASEPGLLFAILLAFAGGIILNLMPCVFPVLFLKALALVNSANESAAHQRRHGVAYTFGILCSFWTIVATLLVLRFVGKEAGWGFQLQSPGFVVGIAFLMFFMALSLAGMFDLGLTLTSAGDSLTRKKGYTGSFFTGVLATVVATPCTAPLMGAAIGFALSRNALVTFAVFTALALGLALPYLLLTLVPGWATKLPRPGSWMETLKQLTAVPLFLTTIWLIWVYGRLSGGTSGDASDHVARLLAGLLILAIGGWILGRWPAKRWGYVAAVLIAIAGFAVPLSASHSDKLQWQPFTSASLQAAQSQGKPVFVDFTAAWCLSCQVNEKVVLQDKSVEDELIRQRYVLLRADWTRYDPEITEALGKVGRSGVPTYVVFSPGAEGSAHVLPELLTRSAVLDAIRHTGS